MATLRIKPVYLNDGGYGNHSMTSAEKSMARWILENPDERLGLHWRKGKSTHSYRVDRVVERGKTAEYVLSHKSNVSAWGGFLTNRITVRVGFNVQ